MKNTKQKKLKKSNKIHTKKLQQINQKNYFGKKKLKKHQKKLP